MLRKPIYKTKQSVIDDLSIFILSFSKKNKPFNTRNFEVGGCGRCVCVCVFVTFVCALLRKILSHSVNCCKAMSAQKALLQWPRGDSLPGTATRHPQLEVNSPESPTPEGKGCCKNSTFLFDYSKERN